MGPMCTHARGRGNSNAAASSGAVARRKTELAIHRPDSRAAAGGPVGLRMRAMQACVRKLSVQRLSDSGSVIVRPVKPTIVNLNAAEETLMLCKPSIKMHHVWNRLLSHCFAGILLHSPPVPLLSANASGSAGQMLLARA